MNIGTFIAKNGVAVLTHPSYSADLAAAEFFLYPKLELTFR
jgi:hypothetical protein